MVLTLWWWSFWQGGRIGEGGDETTPGEGVMSNTRLPGPFLLELIPGGQGELSLEHPLPSRGDCVLRDSAPSFLAPAGQQQTPGLGGYFHPEA